MRKIMLAVLVAAACLSADPAGAQTGASRKTVRKEETVILQGGQDGRTVIEIRDGAVYVNGEKVVSVADGDAATVRKKIIIENGSGGTGLVQGFSGGPADMEMLQQFFDHNFNNDFGGEGPADSRKAMLGVTTEKSPDGKGAVVRRIEPGSAAEKAGLKEGDRITKVDGMNIADPQALVDAISGHKAGEQVSIAYSRGGASKTVQAELGSAGPQVSRRSFRFGPNGWENSEGGSGMPNMMMRPFGLGAGDGDAPQRPKLGVTVEDLSDGSGVRVMEVKPGSVAETAGLQTGDVITAIDGSRTGSVDALQSAVEGLEPGTAGRLSYDRGGQSKTVDVTLPKAVKRREL